MQVPKNPGGSSTEGMAKVLNELGYDCLISSVLIKPDRQLLMDFMESLGLRKKLFACPLRVAGGLVANAARPTTPHTFCPPLLQVPHMPYGYQVLTMKPQLKAYSVSEKMVSFAALGGVPASRPPRAC